MKKIWFLILICAALSLPCANAQIVFRSLPLILGNRYANYFTYEELSDAHQVLIRHSRTAHKYWKRSASLPVKMQAYERDSLTGWPGKPLGNEVWVENTPCRARVKVDLAKMGLASWPPQGCYIAVEFMSLPWYQQHGYYTDSNYFYWETYNIEGVGKRRNKTYVFPQWKCEPSEYYLYNYFEVDVWKRNIREYKYRIMKLK